MAINSCDLSFSGKRLLRTDFYIKKLANIKLFGFL
jgi:hypothetical protein